MSFLHSIQKSIDNVFVSYKINAFRFVTRQWLLACSSTCIRKMAACGRGTTLTLGLLASLPISVPLAETAAALLFRRRTWLN